MSFTRTQILRRGQLLLRCLNPFHDRHSHQLRSLPPEILEPIRRERRIDRRARDRAMIQPPLDRLARAALPGQPQVGYLPRTGLPGWLAFDDRLVTMRMYEEVDTVRRGIAEHFEIGEREVGGVDARF